jgi:hypothetical protein
MNPAYPKPLIEVDLPVHALTQGLENPRSPLTLLERMAVFFVLQRSLYKWGGDQFPRNDAHWRYFRELFLAVAEADIPPEFTPEDNSWLQWNYRHKPELARQLAFIQALHEAQQYKSDS